MIMCIAGVLIFCFLIGEKRFQTIQDLVADGLITMYIDTYAKDYVDTMMIEAVKPPSREEGKTTKDVGNGVLKESEEADGGNKVTHVLLWMNEEHTVNPGQSYVVPTSTWNTKAGLHVWCKHEHKHKPRVNRDDTSTRVHVPFSCACACIVLVHTWLMLVLVLMLVCASYV